MNILAENYADFDIGRPGIRHVMLPRGTSYAVYLPLLCQSKSKAAIQLANGTRSAESHRRALGVLPTRLEVAYVKQRDDIYPGEIAFLSRNEFHRMLCSDHKFRHFCKKFPCWFIDAFDLLQGGEMDRLTELLLGKLIKMELITDSNGECRVAQTPCVLLVHSASVSAAESTFSQLIGRGIVSPVPPPRNKFNMVVRTELSFYECLDAVYMHVMSKSTGVGRMIDGRNIGDIMVIARNSQDAAAATDYLRMKIGNLSCQDAIEVKMVGYIQPTAGLMKEGSARKFCSGVVLSQTLDTYKSDRCTQYGLKKVRKNRRGRENSTRSFVSPLRCGEGPHHIFQVSLFPDQCRLSGDSKHVQKAHWRIFCRRSWSQER